MTNLAVNNVKNQMVSQNLTQSTSAVVRDIKEHLLSGAKVDFGSNGRNVDGKAEMVYTIEGVENLEVSANGYIIDFGEIRYPKLSNDSIYILARKGFKSLNISFRSLITMLNGYLPKGGLVLSLKDEDYGYAPHNLVLRRKFTHDLLSLEGNLEKIGEGLKELPLFESSSLTELNQVISGLYTQVETSIEYVTEDGAVLPTRETAEIHQASVDKGKSVAQIVLDYNQGYVLAEKVYLEHVVYHKGNPYENFRDVMENDTGIVERKTSELVKFAKFEEGALPLFAHMFSEKKYNTAVAEKIASTLDLMQEVYAELESLSKQSV